MPTITNLFTIEEVLQHNTDNDRWVVIDGKVYDVSSYMDDHPGANDVRLLAATGNDAKEGFEDAEHGKRTRELLKDYCIGELDSCSPVISELEIVSKKEASSNVQKLKTERDVREEIEDGGNSSKSAMELKDCCIGDGELDSCSPVIPDLEIVSKEGASNNNVHKGARSKEQHWVVPVAVVCISVVVAFLFLQKRNEGGTRKLV